MAEARCRFVAIHRERRARRLEVQGNAALCAASDLAHHRWEVWENMPEDATLAQLRRAHSRLKRARRREATLAREIEVARALAWQSVVRAWLQRGGK